MTEALAENMVRIEFVLVDDGKAFNIKSASNFTDTLPDEVVGYWVRVMDGMVIQCIQDTDYFVDVSSMAEVARKVSDQSKLARDAAQIKGIIDGAEGDNVVPFIRPDDAWRFEANG